MKFCKRTSKDPLLALFLTKYRVNLLAIPRQELDLGSVFVVRGHDVDNIPLVDLVSGTVRMITVPVNETAINEVAEARSNALDLDTSASLIGRIREVFGWTGGKDQIKTALQNSGAKTLEIKVQGLTQLRVRRDKIDQDLASCRLVPDHPYNDGKSELYVCTGVWKACRLELRSKLDGHKQIELTGSLEDIADAEGRLTVTRGDTLATLIESQVPLVFGVELMRIAKKGDGLTLIDRRPDLQMRAGGEDEPVTEQAMPEPDEDAFLNLR